MGVLERRLQIVQLVLKMLMIIMGRVLNVQMSVMAVVEVEHPIAIIVLADM